MLLQHGERVRPGAAHAGASVRPSSRPQSARFLLQQSHHVPEFGETPAWAAQPAVRCSACVMAASASSYAVSVATVSRGGLLVFTASRPTRARAIASWQAAVNAGTGPEMRAAAAPSGSSSGGGAFTTGGGARGSGARGGGGAGFGRSGAGEEGDRGEGEREAHASVPWGGDHPEGSRRGRHSCTGCGERSARCSESARPRGRRSASRGLSPARSGRRPQGRPSSAGGHECFGTSHLGTSTRAPRLRTRAAAASLSARRRTPRAPRRERAAGRCRSGSRRSC